MRMRYHLKFLRVDEKKLNLKAVKTTKGIFFIKEKQENLRVSRLFLVFSAHISNIRNLFLNLRISNVKKSEVRHENFS